MYIVIELQRTGDQLANIVTAYADLNEAKSKFHQILATAAISTVPVHAAVIVSEEGKVIKNECYRHTDEETTVSDANPA